MKPKHPREVYVALSRAGLSNREIARILGVNESAVRRGLKPPKVQRRPFPSDPWPETRPSHILIEEGPEGAFVLDGRTGHRLLKVPPYKPELVEIGEAVRTIFARLK